ncbi:hypothetical protein FQN54_004494 [Arachnomyces sp. PD_36]|nr:hypothetical protein FQN54_004494 [Arachnomyces sp. PD_36]
MKDAQTICWSALRDHIQVRIMMVQHIFRLGLLVSFTTGGLAALDGSRFLWYNAPATDWETGALPIGNGRLGATTYGGGNEVITVNEDTIWSGPLQDRTPPNGLGALQTVRDLLVGGSITEGGDLVLSDMHSDSTTEREFSYFGNIDLEFGHDYPEDYVRWLDTRQGNSGVSYIYDGVNFTREYIASYPAGVLAARFTAGQEGALNLGASISRQDNILTNEASTDGVNSITMSGSSGQPSEEGPILYTGQARFVADGDISASEGSLTISGATTVDVFIDVETNYRFPTQEEWEAEIDKKLTAAVEQGFDTIKEEALADAGGLLGRASIDLGNSSDGLADLPTNERVDNARGGLGDVQLATLAWNYGRHLLTAASRNTDADIDMPANLQGVWNNQTSAAWGGKFTININTEMNYWLATSTNLVEVEEPLFDLLKVAQPRGQELAQSLYGCDGTVFHHNLDVWGDPAPTDRYAASSMWPMGAAWLVQHMIDHYRFNGDKDFLENTAYPFLVDVAAFYHCYAFEWEGYLVAGPSVSPENTFVVPDDMSVAGDGQAMDIAIEMDNQLLRDVMSAVIEAATELGVNDTDEAVAAAKDFLPRIREPQIGSRGQMLEWRSEYGETEPGHRHLSNLYGLHPGAQFSPLVNEEYSEASRVLLDERVAGGSGSTGWSRTWMINQFARLHDGDEAWGHVEAWFATFPTGNLFNTDSGSTFQIDGNFGFTSGVTEMLLQSHAGVVHILPALPAEAVPTGNAKGLLARGGFEVDVEWEAGEFTSAVVTSTRGGQLSLRVRDGSDFSVDGELYEGPIQTTQGEQYTLTL